MNSVETKSIKVPSWLSSIESRPLNYRLTETVILDKDGMLVCGAWRVSRAVAIGVESLNCFYVNFLNESLQNELIVTDRKISSIGISWDEKILALCRKKVFVPAEIERIDACAEIANACKAHFKTI